MSSILIEYIVSTSLILLTRWLSWVLAPTIPAEVPGRMGHGLHADTPGVPLTLEFQVASWFSWPLVSREGLLSWFWRRKNNFRVITAVSPEKIKRFGNSVSLNFLGGVD